VSLCGAVPPYDGLLGGKLAALLALSSDAARVRVVDVRWSIAASGRAAYEAEHVEGAAFLDLDVDLSAPEGPGRHPIPDAPQLERVFGALGVDAETHVVAYDDAAGAIAARVWFLLRRYGHERVSVLEGGLAAWRAAGGPMTAEVPRFEATKLALTARPKSAPDSDVLDKQAIRALAGRDDTVLIDVRAPERYRGESEPIDARAGHIPGAKNVPWSENLQPAANGVRTMRGARDLRELYASLGADRKDVVFYCGSSVTACLGLLAFEVAGLGRRARVYEGSWSDWSRDANLPIARGDE
jgi:thiosulfate/3-mercaptopyruvate sulfurtransferase